MVQPTSKKKIDNLNQSNKYAVLTPSLLKYFAAFCWEKNMLKDIKIACVILYKNAMINYVGRDISNQAIHELKPLELKG